MRRHAPRNQTFAACLIASALLLAGACRNDNQAYMTLVVTASGSPPAVSALAVTLTGPTGSSMRTYALPSGQAITFPTTLSAEIPAAATGTFSVEVNAENAAGTQIATGHAVEVTVGAGGRPTVYVALDCSGAPCAVDGGSSTVSDGGTAATSPRCGNGRVDPGETCDVAIAPDDPGACPPADCNDGVACTTDVPKGSGCTATCEHPVISLSQSSRTIKDGCCPVDGTAANDPDCSPTCGNGIVDPSETCDTAIAPGQPGSCPRPADCTDGDPCVVTLLISTGTCSAVCVHYQVSRPTNGDGCCPPGATNATDSDCPASCGDGVRQQGETCDVGITPPATGSCPTGCDDGVACTTDFLSGAGCSAICVHSQITAPISGDGCCPPGATHATDSDCAAACGDGLVEPGENCDSRAVVDGACPTACPPSPAACLTTALTGSAVDCSAACTTTAITACSAASDGCCPSGCTASTDPDCSPTCGDGIVEPPEACDVAIAAGTPGACPTTCNDGDPCTDDLLLSSGTCATVCVHLPITAYRAGDGCCPAGGTLDVDADCAAVCGDGVVERPVEACDDAVAGSCPTSCPAASTCTIMTLSGAPATCSAACVATTIGACVGGDQCCPAGCNAVDDTDCPVICGDAAVEGDEACDRAITAGLPGACARTCDDGDACTQDLASGSIEACTRSCTNIPISACLSGDGCCPAGCNATNDADCAPSCGDGRVEAGETCDPPSTCPTTCPDDGDPCTVEQLSGDAALCTAACRHVPITSCSGTTADHCCPTGCTSADDTDC